MDIQNIKSQLDAIASMLEKISVRGSMDTMLMGGVWQCLGNARNLCETAEAEAPVKADGQGV